ncbi:diguanylate cyclase/phosphodiesterase with PAS/PAC sensor(s) [Pseudoalteromonas sp. BSi20652]|uniref:bifunctional diguanylate cyclase/phosphodiesterase n=1 Tax=Pseudoalteromonas sp. BSi20652 TaxID=388384 RepID=UPI000231806F|nr:EAL domain-containing protein [Pseudoalteromonas sp. BSi20652]GAA58714.1 diguanylate cyclase/phosphodiesterase with PAS/PAC sensor(s) [Pseudoalteromonas sp. BSi20652]
MIYRRPPSRFGFNSLSVKLSLLISAICLIAGVCAAALMLQSEEKQLVFEEHEVLKVSTDLLVKQFKERINTKINIAQQANNVVTEQLFQASSPINFSNKSQLQFNSDGTIRSSSADGLSAAFLPQQNYSPFYKRLFNDSEMLWRIISPTLVHDFFNFYLITNDDFIRISPPNWALNAPADFRVTNGSTYKYIKNTLGAEREPAWSKVYYDKVWQKWVISLLVPVYKDNELRGVTGSDISLNKLISFLPVGDKEKHLLVFDSKGQLLAHPNLNPALLEDYGSDDKALLTSEFVNPELQSIIDDVIAIKLPEYANSFKQNDEAHIINIRKIDNLDWYIGVYKKRSSTLSALQDLKLKFFGLFILYAILVAILLHQALYQLVLRRLHTLVYAVTNFGKGQLTTEFPPENKDEIGTLNGSFRDMTVEIRKLIDGLNQRITEKEIAEKAANRLSKAVAFSGTGVVITDENFVIEYVNPKMLEMTGYPESHFSRAPLLNIIASEMSMLVEDIDIDLRSRNYWRGDTLIQGLNKDPIWVSLSVSPIREDGGEITSYVASAQDISFVKESQRKMEQLAYFDTLTGLANRTFFRMQLRKSMALAERGHYAFALFYFDLDEFKRINDTLGHDAGDQLLIEVANRLRKRLRAEDTIARLGGDEFAVLLSGIESQEHATDVANTIQKTLNVPIKLGSNEVIVSASIGITMAPYDSLEEDQLLKHADLAMYEAKAKGRNTFHFYSQELNFAANERLFIESELRIALKEKQFVIYYQPQVDSTNQQVVGYEALLRWFHPTEGLISPDKFIPIAEATGLIVELGKWVLQESCDFAVRLTEQDRENNISINLSARQFKDSNLVSTLSKMIIRSGVSAKRLHLELTESMLMGNVEAAIAQLHELKALGVSISIDDFGTGYSSLSYLKRFPVDILKIDRSFVKDIPEDTNDMEITAAIIAMAQKLNLNVVAEGVETIEQVEFLQKNNCFIVQGYYFSPPIPEKELPSLFDKLNKLSNGECV